MVSVDSLLKSAPTCTPVPEDIAELEKAGWDMCTYEEIDSDYLAMLIKAPDGQVYSKPVPRGTSVDGYTFVYTDDIYRVVREAVQEWKLSNG